MMETGQTQVEVGNLPAPPHAVSAETCVTSLNSDRNGLPSTEAAKRLAAEGLNALPSIQSLHPVLRFLAHFRNVLIYVLIASAVITAMLQHWVDTAVIVAVVLVNAIVGYVQEGRAENAMSAIRSMLAPKATVLRDGRRTSVSAEELVRGDIVMIEAGDKVPADLRLLSARSLRVEEAILTGESVPVEKGTDPVATNASVGDRRPMVFSGTSVVGGTGRGIVVATGQATEIGRISDLVRSVDVLTTPLVGQMNRFAQWLTALILILAALLLAFGFFVGHIPFDEMFMAVVGLTVAAIPEGLPAVLTITLAIGVQRMARRHVIVRKLPSIETLGAVSVICSDKTGTLTQNEMTVASISLPSGHYVLTGGGYAPHGEVVPAPPSKEITEFARIAALCNDAELKDVAGTWSVEGDPMEGALLAFAGMVGTEVRGWRRLDEIPFDAAHRYMAVLVESPAGDRHILVKGAPERILDMCRLRTEDDAQVSGRGDWLEESHRIARGGQRVIALASVPTEEFTLRERDIEGHLILAGLVGLIDPPRPEVIEAVAQCHRAGIAIKMITGDHVGTATAIGKQIGLLHAEKALTGSEIERLSDVELAHAVHDTNIFARTSPEHKLRLVTALQAQGLIVAMTGDGVNDAPALKRADAGVAMGIKGSTAAKEAAELVLTDDNFASIAAAVQEGRTVFDNLRKVISWTLPTNAGEAGTVIVALLLGFALPISPIQILWVNLITAVTLGLSLAFEPTEPGTMQRRPRPRNAPLLTGELAWHVILVGILFIAAVFGLYAYSMDRGYSQATAQTISMNILVILEIFHLLFIRNLHGASLTWAMLRGTRAVWICLGIIVPAQLVITYIPIAQILMGTEPISLADGLLMIAIGMTFFAIIEVEKRIRLTLRRRNGP